MNEAEALQTAWKAIDSCGLRSEVKGLKSIRLSTVKEFRESFGFDPVDPRDLWHVLFWMTLDNGMVQHPDTIRIIVDDRTGEI